METYILFSITMYKLLIIFQLLSLFFYQLPFPVIGSLNGVCMFASNQDASLLNTVTDDAKVVWKVFHEK